MTGPGTRYDTGPTIAAAVADKHAAFNGGVFTGDPELVDFAQRLIEHAVEVDVFGQRIVASTDTPLQVLAAMAAYSPGRVIVTEAPDEVLDAIRSEDEVGVMPDDTDATVDTEVEEIQD